METLAFYSYKGGVGRSLLLANAARFLAAMGKGVVALDFDFEAPGLHYKLAGGARRKHKLTRKGGAVPYLLATSDGAASPPSLKAHLIDVPVPPECKGWLRLMPAGQAPERAYWAALKELGDRLRFDDPSGQGLMAVLDLQARIEEELKPDYLLVDARTGVTEIGALATTILADTVICMFVANQESLDGTLTVVEALTTAPRLKGQKPVRVVPILSRTMEKQAGGPGFAAGVARLLELAEAKKAGAQQESELFSLPHDEVVGAAERVVAGERRASAFSPLYKTYLELFQKLFPSGAERARQALERLEAVASVKEALTEPRRGPYPYGVLISPWSAGAIEEGVVFQAESYGQPASRYADLICGDQVSRTLMAVEYVAENGAAEARTFWESRTDVRCLILLRRHQHGLTRQILTRGPGEQRLREAHRWDPPLPREFEILPDVGDRSVEALLDALRRGHAEAATWLIEEWQQATAAVSFPKEPRWRPGRARRILDGLAATEDLGCAEEILRQAAPGGPEAWSEGRHWRRLHFEDFPGQEIDRWLAEDLFAPLFWRLPVEAVLRYLEPTRFPDETPCLAGYRILAEGLMGLRYGPQRFALADGQDIAARMIISGKSDGGNADDFPVQWLIRSRRDLIEQVRLSEELPPVLVWEELLQKVPLWRGTLEAARDETTQSVRKGKESIGAFRRRLRGAVEKRTLVTQGLLGYYDSPGRLELYPAVISGAADLLGLSSRYLTSVVFIHLSVLALAHQARDLDGEPGYGFAPSTWTTTLRESPVHVGLAQAFTHRLIQNLQDANLLAAFEKLSQHQPEAYRRWINMKEMPIERLRELLLRARASASAVGLPHHGNQG